MMAAGILIFIICAIVGFAADNHASSDGRSERAARILRAVSSVCGWGVVVVGPFLIVASIVTWLWRVMP